MGKHSGEHRYGQAEPAVSFPPPIKEPPTAPLKVVKTTRVKTTTIWSTVGYTIGRYVKGIVAVIGAAATALVPLYIGDEYIDLPEQAQVVVAVLTALGVISLPNKPKRKKE